MEATFARADGGRDWKRGSLLGWKPHSCRWFNPPSEPQRATPMQSAVPLKVLRPSMAYAVLSVRACGPLRNHGPLSVNVLATSFGGARVFLLAAVFSGPCLLRDPSALTVASARPWAPATGIHAGTTHPYPPAILGRPRLGVARTTPPVVRSGHRCAAWSFTMERVFAFQTSLFTLHSSPLRAAPLPWPPLTARCLRSALLAPLASEPGSMAQATPRRRHPRTNRQQIPRANNAGTTATLSAPAARWKPRPEFRRDW